MENKLKPILSMMAVCLFLLIAMATIGADSSTNTTVAISDCKDKPFVDVQLLVNISFKNKAGKPIKNAYGEIFITHQIVNHDSTCTFKPYYDSVEFYTDNNGNFSHEGILFAHGNSEDLYRVEIVMPKTALYAAVKTVQVKKYSTANFTFNITGIRLSEL